MDGENGVGTALAGLFGGACLGAALLGVDWLLAKALLHGQLGHLVWMPVGLGVAFCCAFAIGSRFELAGAVLMMLGLLTALVFAPIAEKLYQHHREDHYVQAVHLITSAEPQILSRQQIVTAGWELCSGLDAVSGAPDGAFAASDPALTVARFVMGSSSGNVVVHASPGDEEEMTEIVHSADAILC